MDGLFRRRRLPHWDVEDGTYFVTACLEGSISTLGIGEIRSYRSELDERPVPANTSSEDWERTKHKLPFARMDQILDGNPAVRHFDDHRSTLCKSRASLNCFVRSLKTLDGEHRSVAHDYRLTDIESANLLSYFETKSDVIK